MSQLPDNLLEAIELAIQQHDDHKPVTQSRLKSLRGKHTNFYTVGKYSLAIEPGYPELLNYSLAEIIGVLTHGASRHIQSPAKLITTGSKAHTTRAHSLVVFHPHVEGKLIVEWLE